MELFAWDVGDSLLDGIPCSDWFSCIQFSFFSSGTLSQVIEQGGIGGINHETGRKDSASGLDHIALPVAKGMLSVINLVKEFSPVSFLSTGRSITVGILFQAFTQIVLMMGGIFAAFGMWAFYRSELATAQGNQ